MKNFMILAVVFMMAVFDVNSQPANGMPPEMMKTLTTCMSKLGITMLEAEEARKTHDITNPKFKCFSECLLSEDKILENGEIKIEKIKEMLKKFNVNIAEADIDKVHEKCLAEAKPKEDKCEFAQAYQICSIKEMHQLAGASKN